MIYRQLNTTFNLTLYVTLYMFLLFHIPWILQSYYHIVLLQITYMIPPNPSHIHTYPRRSVCTPMKLISTIPLPGLPFLVIVIPNRHHHHPIQYLHSNQMILISPHLTHLKKESLLQCSSKEE